MGFKSSAQRRAVFARLLKRARMLRKSGMLRLRKDRGEGFVGRGVQKGARVLVPTRKGSRFETAMDMLGLRLSSGIRRRKVLGRSLTTPGYFSRSTIRSKHR